MNDMPENRRRKLQMLTRTIAQGDFAKARELLKAPAGQDAAADGQPAAEGPLPLAEACPGCQAHIQCAAGALPYWLIRKAAGQVGPDAQRISRQYAAVMRGERQRFDELEASVALCHVADAQPQDVLFMDIESCGLYGASVFLVGMMLFEDDQLVFEQHLARDYTEEPAVLRAFAQRHSRAGVLVTFNGKSFDMNMIRDRSAFHGVELWDDKLPHLDLLHESRRRWRGKLPNCRLQTLETHLCSRRRVGDIPGWAIPDAYHRFVDTGDARQLRDILHHNLLDLLTMAELLTFILTGVDPEAAPPQAEA
jgi:uncharacterized protein YprB with RNaseH-like and TPR domain